MDECDVTIVGAGPIGCFVAERLASKGRNVSLFEEHPGIGEPLHCAGLVTQRVFDITDCPAEEIVQNKIYGAIIHSPNGQTLTIGGETIHALVIDRQAFDSYLAQKAKRVGAQIFLQHTSATAQRKQHHIELTTHHNEQITTIKSKLLIGADGPHSHIRRLFNFSNPKETIKGIGAELTNTNLDPRYVHIYVGQTIAPGFFAWVIPTNTGGTTARIGLCIRKNSLHRLQHYYLTLLQQPLLKETTVMRQFGGTIPLGPLKNTVDDHLMLVGDAAAQVKPTSGGGLYPGLLCATHCSTVAEDALANRRFNAQFLKRYHIKWTKDIGRELSLGMKFRTIFTRLTDSEFNKYLEKFNKEKITQVISIYGDIDYPSRLVLPLIKVMPSLLSFTPTLLKRKKK